MRRRDQVRYWCIAAAALIGLWSAVAPAQRHDSVVLIVNAKSEIVYLSSVEVRKLFTGLPVMRGGHQLRALRNESDTLLDQVFLQNIVSMSEPTYERRVRALAKQQGRVPMPAVHSTHDLLQSLAGDTSVVSFAWASEVSAERGVRVLGVLWQD